MSLNLNNNGDLIVADITLLVYELYAYELYVSNVDALSYKLGYAELETIFREHPEVSYCRVKLLLLGENGDIGRSESIQLPRAVLKREISDVEYLRLMYPASFVMESGISDEWFEAWSGVDDELVRRIGPEKFNELYFKRINHKDVTLSTWYYCDGNKDHVVLSYIGAEYRPVVVVHSPKGDIELTYEDITSVFEHDKDLL